VRQSFLVAAIALLFARVVGADPVTLSGGGTLDYVGCCGTLGSTKIGDPFTFALTFDSPSSDLFPLDPHFGYYTLGTGSFTVTVGTTSFSRGMTDAIAVVSDDGPSDDLRLFLTEVASELELGVGLQLLSNRNDWFSGDSYPADLATAFNSGPAGPEFLFLSRSRSDDDTIVLATGRPGRIAQEPAPAPVPEPSSLLLLGFGSACFGVQRWRQRKP
jgi:hypothetical protein